MSETRKDHFWSELFKVAIPISIQYLINQLLVMIDNIMIGSLHENNITAVTICTTFLWLSTMFFMGTGEGLVIVSAKAYGQKDISKIKRTFSVVALINVLVAVLLFLVISLIPEKILLVYSNIPEVMEAGVVYLKYARYTVLFGAVSTSITMLLQSVKSVRVGLVSSIASCILNVVLNWLLIFGNLGFPQLGVRGAAIATVGAKIIEMLIVLFYFFFMDKKIRFRLSDFRLEKDKYDLQILFKTTYPLLLIDILTNLVSSVQTMITGHISQYYVAANSIVHNSWVIPTIFSYGLSNAASVMVGNELGKGKKEEIVSYGRKFLYFSIALGIFNACMVQVLLPVISSFYDVEQATLILARKMGYYASITTFFNTVSTIVCTGVIKSTGKTQILLVIDLVSNWLLAIPFGYLAAFVLGWPAETLYLILRGGNIVKTIWGIYQITSDKWIQGTQLQSR